MSDPDLFSWLALRRVDRGGAAKIGDYYLNHGRSLPCFLPEALDDLIRAGLLVLAEEDPVVVGLRRIQLTDEGRARYAVLCQRRGTRAASQSSSPSLFEEKRCETFEEQGK